MGTKIFGARGESKTPHSTQRERKKSEQAKEVSAREARANTAFNTKRKKETASKQMKFRRERREQTTHPTQRERKNL
jgi:hypothetical protein